MDFCTRHSCFWLYNVRCNAAKISMGETKYGRLTSIMRAAWIKMSLELIIMFQSANYFSRY